MDLVHSAIVLKGLFSLQLGHNFPESRDAPYSILFSTAHTLDALKQSKWMREVANHKFYPCIEIGKSTPPSTSHGRIIAKAEICFLQGHAQSTLYRVFSHKTHMI